MNEMKQAYTKLLEEVCNEIKTVLCNNESSIEDRVVKAKNDLMLADQSFLFKINIINSKEWLDCTQKFKIALKNLFGNILLSKIRISG